MAEGQFLTMWLKYIARAVHVITYLRAVKGDATKLVSYARKFKYTSPRKCFSMASFFMNHCNYTLIMGKNGVFGVRVKTSAL